jgi:predicted O-methyltransferase YrrM
MNSLIIESTKCQTRLCALCHLLGTDKGPYTRGNGHRHPYTGPYSLLFEPLRNKSIKFAEIGVFKGNSLAVWREFFPKARLFGFDNDANNLEYISKMGLRDISLGIMDGSQKNSIQAGLAAATTDGELLDVVLDDASHDPNDQCMMIRSALPFLKQGGILIIEDIFRDRSEEPYKEALAEVNHMVSFHTFIVCEHVNRYSPGWNNDKLLIIVKA